MKPILLAASSTIEGITDLIKRFYGGSSIRLEGSAYGWDVFNAKGKIDNVRVVFARRYRFERV